MRSRGYRSRVLAIQAMAGETSWLDGRPRWHEGHVVWETDQGILQPGVSDLALAQRRLMQIAAHPHAAVRALGDAVAWLQRRTARLELAKKLHTIEAPDLAALAQRASLKDSRDAPHLVALLTAEALCLGELPASPSRALVAHGIAAAPLVLGLLRNEGMPLPIHVLAALVLGAIERQCGLDRRGGKLPPAADRLPVWQAYAWGHRTGLPNEPAFVAALLAAPDGPPCAQRAMRAVRHPGPFGLSPTAIRAALAGDAPAASVVAVAEALVAARPLAARIQQYRDLLPGYPADRRRSIASELREERQGAVAALAAVLHEYARATLDAAVVGAAVRFTHLMLDLSPALSEPIEAAIVALRGGLKLPAHLLLSYVELLVQESDYIWSKESIAGSVGGHSLRGWFDNCQQSCVRPLQQLLATVVDGEIARQALQTGMLYVLADYSWRDPDRYRLALDLVQDLSLDKSAWSVKQDLCRVVGEFVDARHARTMLAPLARTISAMPAIERRGLVLTAVLDNLPHMRGGLNDVLPRLTGYVGHLIAFVTAHENVPWRIPDVIIKAALALDRALPGRAASWLDALLGYMSRWLSEGQRGYRDIELLWLRTRFAIAFADGDLALFMAMVRTPVPHDLDYDDDAIDQALAGLDRFPALRLILAEAFPRYSRRCVTLAVRAGLATRLGHDALAPLATLAGLDPSMAGGRQSLPSDWDSLVETTPELAALASTSVHARRLIDGDTAVPAGIRRALDQPHKLAGELSYLEGLLAHDPMRRDIATRVDNLRARLADANGLRAFVRGEVGERLAHLAIEAGLATAERLVISCYRARLADVAGPLPPDLTLGDDLLNATLLTVDIRANRRLLLRLLRAHVAGDHQWREEHPANAAFLRKIALHGVDIVAWLKTHPRSYPCVAVPGGRLHVRLERDPLRILQMGNLFDTCLSFGGINSFSAVSNAAELNKRVVYARDGAGRVAGRKLIGISADGRLVGFHTYSALHDEAGNAALRGVMRHYLAGFAARCGLALADEGTVPTLFAEEWYDDGAVRGPATSRPPRPYRHRLDTPHG